MAAFFAMGGYAGYVWPSYLVSLLVLGTAIVVTLRAYARARRLVQAADGGE